MKTWHKAITALALCAGAGGALWLPRTATMPPPPAVPRPPPALPPERVSPFGEGQPSVTAQAAARRAEPVQAPSAKQRIAADDCVDDNDRHSSDAPPPAAPGAAHAAALLVDGRTDQLAAMSASSPDPVAYAIAWQACLQTDLQDAPSCSLLKAAQWARLEPDNGVVWLALAEEAAAQGDEQTEADAMGRAAAAPRARNHSAAVPALLETAARPSHAQSLDTLTAGWRATSMWRAVGLGQVHRYCSRATAGGERELVCNGLAAMLVYRASDLQLRSAGIELARRLGWPAAHVEALSEEQDALAEIGGPQTMISGLDCGNALRVQRWMASVEAQGEVQRLRELLAVSGLSTRDWSLRRRRDLALAESTVEAVARHGD